MSEANNLTFAEQKLHYECKRVTSSYQALPINQNEKAYEKISTVKDIIKKGISFVDVFLIYHKEGIL